ncbi:MAG TPA: response regulator transcription factor [Verrucomicrobiae bacterium]|jgi:DNA-binding NarL/FixJ family response regulator|nr:response regulator transcription factor [Verrucomicrobiae bacterium]
MKAYTQKIIHVSVLESDPVRFLGLRAIFPSQAGIQIRKGSVISVLEGPEDELVLMTVNRGPAFYAGMSALKAARPEIKIIVTGPGDNDEDILRAVTAGAKGYISEEATADQFKKAIHEVHAGSVWIPRRVLAMFIERVTTSARRLEPSNASKISEREREVLRLLVAGCSNREIASELGIIERTVKAHVAQLLRKVGVTNRIALSVHAVTHSLLSTTQ